jgi:EF hand
MFINQNFSDCSWFLKLNVDGFVKIKRIVLLSRLAIACVLLFLSPQALLAGPRDNQNINDELSKSQQSDNSKSSNEAVGVNIDENIRLRRALDEYSRTVDPAHVQIEERRRVMHQRIQERFSQADRDNDGSISLEEAYDAMPQLARHFGAVDLNGDHMITLEELEALQAKIAERQRIATIKIDTPEADNVKSKNKPGSSSNHKSAL